VGAKRFDGTETFVIDEPPAPPGPWFKVLLNKQYLATTLLLWLVFTFNTLCLYAYVNWLPTVLDSIGMPLHDSLQGSKLFNFGGMFGAIGGAVLIGYFGSRAVGTGLASIGAIVTLVIGLTIVGAGSSASTQLLTLICIAGMAMNGMQSFIYTVGTHSYPTYIRATGVGAAQTVSRIGGVLSSSVGGAYFAIKPTPPVSYFFYVIAGAVVVVVIGFYSLRTHIHGRSGRGGGRTVPEPTGRAAPTV
jgi:AAHS family 4-hydroxybenzoate transporter-like MFS transporter